MPIRWTKYGIPENVAVRVACGLVRGLCEGEVCGAVSGAILVIEATHGNEEGSGVGTGEEEKAYCYEQTQKFIKCFKEVNQSTIYRELIKCDVSTEEGVTYARKHDIFHTTCVELIKSAVTILEELGY
ncbi:MAG: C-GCAxxG-C-C family protein [bacterium]|nr:C-GCAxxG-C-C family protein [bacterium]